MKRSTRLPAAPPPQTLVERSELPRIFVQSKGQNRYAAYVHSYVIGPPVRVKSVDVTPLYSLSLVAMHGEGNVLQGLWSALVANSPQEIHLEGVGRVVLATPVHANLGYRLHWNYHQATLTNQDIHAVIESHMLTLSDPVRGVAPMERERKKKQIKATGKRKPRSEKVELSTLAKHEQGDREEEMNRQHFPLFLLLVPGIVQPRRGKGEGEGEYVVRCKIALDAYRAAHHFTFLNMRIPWPMASEWAEYLWERGIARKEITPLTVWNPAIKQHKQEEDQEEEKTIQALPLFLEGWLCQPNPTLLPADLKQARNEGRLSFPQTSPRVLPEIVGANR
jgi:hypothetical protein